MVDRRRELRIAVAVAVFDALLAAADAWLTAISFPSWWNLETGAAFAFCACWSLALAPRAHHLWRDARPVEWPEPILAWKQARLNLTDPRCPPFRSLNGVAYGLDERAHHYNLNLLQIVSYTTDAIDGSHSAPQPSCTCGFWATKERGPAWPWYVQLRVELSGRVVEHELGYRAERQRVLAVMVPHWCYECFHEQKKAAAVALLPKVLAGNFSIHDAPEVLAVVAAVDRSATRVTDRGGPICDWHASRRGTTFTLAELAGRLGCDTRWDTPLSSEEAA